MLNTINDSLTAAETHDEVAAAVAEIQRSFPFEYAMIGDSLRWFAERAAEGQKPAAIEQLRKKVMPTITTRLQSLSAWSQEGNQTVDAIRSGELDPRSIKPHVRGPEEKYDEQYEWQNSNFEATGHKTKDGRWADRNARPLPLGQNLNHAVRKIHAINTLEMLFGIWGRKRKEVIRWIDIGCGKGHITNSVDPARFWAVSWDIVGADFQAAKIEYAQSERAQGRQFDSIDAFELLEQGQQSGVRYDFVSMFEFLEHLDDPLLFLRRLRVFEPRFVIAASPLAQKVGNPHECKVDRIHFWSYTRASFERMLELAGFEPVYSSEVRIGEYVGGMDWLTVVSGPRETWIDHRHAATKIGNADE